MLNMFPSETRCLDRKYRLVGSLFELICFAVVSSSSTPLSNIGISIPSFTRPPFFVYRELHQYCKHFIKRGSKVVFIISSDDIFHLNFIDF